MSALTKPRHPSFAPLIGARVLLRVFRAEDAAPLSAALNDWEVTRWLAEVPFPYSVESARGFIAFTHAKIPLGKRYDLAIEDRATRRLIGGIALREESGAREVGYWIARPFWGRGLASEALELLLSFAARQGRNLPLTASAAEENSASRRVLEKAGFAPCGFSIRNFPARGRLVRVATYQMMEAQCAA